MGVLREQLQLAGGVVEVLVEEGRVGVSVREDVPTGEVFELAEGLAAGQDVFDHLVGLHPSYFEENRSGEIMSRLTTDTTLLQSVIGSSASMALRS